MGECPPGLICSCEVLCILYLIFVLKQYNIFMKYIGIPFIWGPIRKSNINSFAKCSQPLNSTPHKYKEPHKNKFSRSTRSNRNLTWAPKPQLQNATTLCSLQFLKGRGYQSGSAGLTTATESGSAGLTASEAIRLAVPGLQPQRLSVRDRVYSLWGYKSGTVCIATSF